MFEYLPDNVPIEETVKNNIVNCAFTKVKKAKQKKLIKTVTSLAASFGVVFCLMWAVGFENVAKAAEKIFYFLPGFGVTEQGGSELLVLKKNVSRENENLKVTICNATLDSDPERLPGILLDVRLENISEKFKFAISEYDFTYSIKVNGNEYNGGDVLGRYCYGNENTFIGRIRIYTPKENISSDMSYTLIVENPEFGAVEVPFKLVNSDTADNIQVQNIGVTEVIAVEYSVNLDGKTYTAVDITVNGSDESYHDAGVAYKTEDGDIVAPEFKVGNASYFDSSAITKDHKLTVTDIMCDITPEVTEYIIPIPKDGETENTDIEFVLPHGTVRISEVSRKNNYIYFKPDVESEYGIFLYGVSFARQEWYVNYADYYGDGYFIIGADKESLCLIDPDYDGESITVICNNIAYMLTDRLTFDFN